jgi:hypothetical protein
VAAEIPDEIPPDCTVYRLAKNEDIKPDGTPKSSCFSDKAEEDGSSNYMSVFFSDEIQAAGKSVLDLQQAWGADKYTVLAFRAADLREQGERLWRDAIDEFPGHGACKRANGANRTLPRKRNLAKIARVAPELL